MDTSGLADNYILYSGLEVLPIGGYLGNVPAPTLAALQSDINDGYVRFFVLPVSPTGSDPRVRWIEAHCPRQPRRPNSPPAAVRDLRLRDPRAHAGLGAGDSGDDARVAGVRSR